jgi:hypothetical protein
MIDQDPLPLAPVQGHFTDLFTASKKPPVFVVDCVLPEGLTFIIGPPKAAFKSSITMALAALVAGHECQALPVSWKPLVTGPVMVFSYEASAGELRVLMEDGLGVKGAANESILVADEPDTFRLDDEDAVEEMLGWLEERKPALVILDPLANFHTLEEKDAAKMIHILSPLRRWAKENGAAFLIVHHTRKLNEDRAYRADDARGTSAIFGLADGLLAITPGKKPYELLIDGQFKRAPAWTKTIVLGAWDRRGMRGAEALSEVDKLVIRAIAHGYATPDAIAKHCNMSLARVGIAAKALERNGILTIKNKKLALVNKGILKEAA